MREIGSEFWTVDIIHKDNDLEFLKIGQDQKFVMSGMTAIDFVLKDINDNKKIVYMPDYCCESMIKPFIDNGYQIKYYASDVINNKYDIDISFDCSIFFAMSYFGYNSSNMDNYIKEFSDRNIIVIEDITHRLLCDKNYCNNSTYLIASLRKWFPIISGGIAIKMHDEFKNNIDHYVIDEKFVEIKEKAMNLKREYILGNSNNKDEFLELFAIANSMIQNYANKMIDEKSLSILRNLDIESIKERRINNCKLIDERIKNIKNIRLLYNYHEGDCPLFVPIMLNNRDNIRKKLIVKNIYLPIHWPNIGLENDIYNLELSLINDQRYSGKDIIEYINTFIEIMGE